MTGAMDTIGKRLEEIRAQGYTILRDAIEPAPNAGGLAGHSAVRFCAVGAAGGPRRWTSGSSRAIPPAEDPGS
ncbi:MAG: hypothetical protein CL938_18565 [Deltaproteobacteria bacterium]|jgi:hypothetical protein|nr:hypothetical protein [Deltaproteobacteria bacterium]MBT40540.1 hypothetical protein [Deltaproteobacteria bacterium]MDP7301409.1 hypothetical protein [Myxococcota bacterium]